MDSFEITVDPIVDLSNINTLFDQCQAALKSEATTIYLNASKVERLKTPVYQLIIAFQRTLEAQNKKLQIKQPSNSFVDVANSLSIW